MHDASALDAAIADSAACAFARLTQGLSRAEKAHLVSHALDSLHGSIGRLEMPEYGEDLVALFYSVWYQPFQVNAAYSLILRAFGEFQSRLANKRRLVIVDFGSGTWATEVGLALATMDAGERGSNVRDISVRLVEPSDAMTRAGIDIWERFVVSEGHDVSVDVAAFAAQARVGSTCIDIRRVGFVSEIAMPPESERWLLAMHAYYAEAQDAIRSDLAQIGRVFQPDFGVFTCHRDSVDGINYVSPFDGSGSLVDIPPLRLSGELPRVNRWRRELAYELGLQDDVRLTRPTEWDPERGLRDNRALVFNRE